MAYNLKNLIKRINGRGGMNESWKSYNKNIAGDIKDENIDPKENENSDKYVSRLLTKLNRIYFGNKTS